MELSPGYPHYGFYGLCLKMASCGPLKKMNSMHPWPKKILNLVEVGLIEPSGPFDAVFIDANKAAYPEYLEWSHKNLRKGGLVIADNILLHGELNEDFKTDSPHFSKNQVLAMKKFLGELNGSIGEGNHPRWESIVLPTSDGFAVALKG